MTLVVVAFYLALIPATLYLVNLHFYRPPPAPNDVLPPVSLLIPARNEERTLAHALESALATRGIEFEIVVLNDHSEDRTADIVREFVAKDARVRLESAPPLPAGWCGKQHACLVLAGLARHELLAFIDADVRLAPDGLARAATFLNHRKADLVSGVPLQETGTLLERLLIPLIHFILMGFLPMAGMRWTRLAAFGAGCGQLFVARRDAYWFAGGHAAVHTSLHDGVTLPRAFRRAGLTTDLFDATDIATCRMYRSNGETWRGLAKNAREGLAATGTIVPITLILLAGQVLPSALLAAFPWLDADSRRIAFGAAILAWLPRVDAARRFHQSALGALLHPLGIVLLLAIQWFALVRAILGKPAVWKGREYP